MKSDLWSRRKRFVFSWTRCTVRVSVPECWQWGSVGGVSVERGRGCTTQDSQQDTAWRKHTMEDRGGAEIHTVARGGPWWSRDPHCRLWRTVVEQRSTL